MAPKKQNRSAKQPDNTFEIYSLLYRKHKYWLSIFYLVSLIVIAMMYNYKVLGTLANFKQVQRDYFFLTRLNESFNISEIGQLQSFLPRKLKYKPRTTPWADAKKHIAKYWSQRKNVTSFVDSLTNFEYHADIGAYNRRDSLTLDKIYDKYNQKIEDITELENKEERIAQVIIEKQNYTTELDDSLKHSTEQFPLGSLSQSLLHISGQIDTTKSFQDLYDELERKYSNVDSLLNQDFSIPNILVPLKSRFLILISFPVLLILCIYSQMLFLSFKNLEINFKRNQALSLLLPTVENIFRGLSLKLPVQEPLLKILSMFFNVILPIIVILFLSTQMWGLYGDITFIFLIVLYITFETYLFYQTRDLIIILFQG